MGTPIDGGCFCKAVRYRLHREPMFVNCCHCLNCQAQTGSAFVVNAIIETNQIELLSGELVVYEVVSGHGGPHDIFRCSECGVAVWSRYERREGMRLVRVCTLDDPTLLEPQAHIFTRSKLPWVTLPEGVPSFEAFYKTQEVWPEESFKRAMAAMNM
jgi:hypothetical protein